MSDLLADGAAWLAGQLAANASSSIRYCRGTQCQTIDATIGSSTFEAQNTSGVIETWQSRDFIIKAGTLSVGEPARGDRITEVIDGVSLVYEVASPKNTAWWEYGDKFRKTIRIHTVGTVKT